MMIVFTVVSSWEQLSLFKHCTTHLYSNAYSFCPFSLFKNQIEFLLCKFLSLPARMNDTELSKWILQN